MRAPILLLAGLFLGVLFLPELIRLMPKSQLRRGTVSKCTSANYCNTSTSIGFKPKAVIFYWTSVTAHGFTIDSTGGYGFAASTTSSVPQQRAVAAVLGNDSDATAEGARLRTASSSIIMAVGTNTHTLDAFASTTAFTSTGFNLGWGGVNTTGYIVQYYAIGGEDITDTDVQTFWVTTSGSSQATSTLSFKPDMLFFAWNLTSGLAIDAVTQNMGSIGLGMASSSTAQASMFAMVDDADGGNISKRWQQRTPLNHHYLNRGQSRSE